MKLKYIGGNEEIDAFMNIGDIYKFKKDKRSYYANGFEIYSCKKVKHKKLGLVEMFIFDEDLEYFEVIK